MVANTPLRINIIIKSLAFSPIFSARSLTVIPSVS